MQDIRRPYSRSKSNRDIPSRVESFERNSYEDEEEYYEDEPVQIPVRQGFRERREHRNLAAMDMYPARGRRAYDNDEPVYGRRSTDVVVRDPRTRYRDRESRTGTIATVITVLALAVGGLLLTFVFNHATITVVPKHDDITDFSQTITFAREGTDTAGAVPFIVATDTLSESKALTLSDTKQVQSKASGKIVIYNNYSTDPVKLIKNTRFESSAGQIYRINQSVTIPGKSGGKPGSIEVTVYADSYGADYNAAPSDFTIPGFKGAPQYTTVYARSDGALTGGASGNMSIASLSDVNAAKDELALQLAQEMKADLAKINKDGYVGLYNAVDIVYNDNEQDLLTGSASTYQVTATGYLMLAKEDDLAQAIAKTVRGYSGAPVRLDYADQLTYTKKDADSIASSDKMDILVAGQPRIVYVTDTDSLKRMVLGKHRSDFTKLMESIDSIEGAEISFSPLWLSTFPDDPNKISIIESLPKRP